MITKFFNNAIELVKLNKLATNLTNTAHTYPRVIVKSITMIHHFDSIPHDHKKWRNNLIASDHEAIKRMLNYRQSFQSLQSAKATLIRIETITIINRGHIHHKQPNIKGENLFINKFFSTYDPAESICPDQAQHK